MCPLGPRDQDCTPQQHKGTPICEDKSPPPLRPTLGLIQGAPLYPPTDPPCCVLWMPHPAALQQCVFPHSSHLRIKAGSGIRGSSPQRSFSWKEKARGQSNGPAPPHQGPPRLSGTPHVLVVNVMLQTRILTHLTDTLSTCREYGTKR